MNCRDCRHWIEPERLGHVRFGLCELISHNGCEDIMNEAAPAVPAYTQGDSFTLDSDLYTAADFGCTAGQERE